MRFSPIPVIIAVCAILTALSSPAFAAASCPGGGSPTNCKAHCTLTNPPVCTEQCDCAITKNRIGGSAAATRKAGGGGSTGPTKPTLPTIRESPSTGGRR
jgi:hypothetical protein